MKYSAMDVVSIGILACAVVLTGVVVRREFTTTQPRPAVTKVTPRPDVQLVGRPIGPADAPVSIVVFADFQCPYCAKAQSLIRETLSAYPEDVKIMYRHLPIETIHPHAWTAALAAECAGAQGVFPAYHDLLYSHQDSIGTISWNELAVRAGVSSSAKFDECLAEKRYAGEVERDVQLARDLKIDGTPTFIIGDEAYSGVPPASWIRKQIAKTRPSGI